MNLLSRSFAAATFAVGCWTSQVNAAPYDQPYPYPNPPAPSSYSVPQTHSHNDYEHTYPLFDALSYGFISVEADIWLYPNDNENLRVAHDPVAVPSTLPTLQELYLTPLQNLAIQENNGGVYADGTPIILLVDIKSEGVSTYTRLDQILAEYTAVTPGLFTTYTKNGNNDYSVSPGAVSVIISGNRPLDLMLSQPLRYAGYDGRSSDIGTEISSGFMPLISDNWNNVFFGDSAWNGIGAIPSATQAKLESIVAQVHEEGKILRFWNLPQDTPNVWSPLYEADVDLINTDNLAGLSEFIQSQQSVPEPGSVLGFFALGVLGLGLRLKQKDFLRRSGKRDH